MVENRRNCDCLMKHCERMAVYKLRVDQVDYIYLTRIALLNEHTKVGTTRDTLLL